MLAYDVKKAMSAVQYLVDSSYRKHHFRKLRTYVKKEKGFPFKDEAEPLNELLVIGRQNIRAMENLLALVEFKAPDYNTYQKEHMAAKRARERKAVIIEETLFGRIYTLDEAKAAIEEFTVNCRNEKDAYVESRRKRHKDSRGVDPTWEERNQLLRDFWVFKDRELDAMLEEAKNITERKLNPSKNKTVIAPKDDFSKEVNRKLSLILNNPRRTCQS